MTALEKLGVFQLYLSKTKFKKRGGWKCVPMHMIFDVNKEDLRRKARLLVGGHVVDFTENTTYSSTIKDAPERLILLISVNNGLGIMAGDIKNALCMSPCDKND